MHHSVIQEVGVGGKTKYNLYKQDEKGLKIAQVVNQAASFSSSLQGKAIRVYYPILPLASKRSCPLTYRALFSHCSVGRIIVIPPSCVSLAAKPVAGGEGKKSLVIDGQMPLEEI